MPVIDFHRRFHPLTAHPFDREDCAEYPPCEALRPYVRCFWGPVAVRSPLVVPDACADIILRMDRGGMEMSFAPVDNTPYSALRPCRDLFGVRFYFWALPCFDLGGGFGEESFPDLRGYLAREGFPEADFAGRMRIMERYLLARLRPDAAPATFLCAMDRLIGGCGRERISEVAAGEAVSPRTLERMFRRCMGISPKEAAEVIRYQTLWRRALSPRFDVMDQVEALGFCDQAHLLGSFRRFHSLPLREAVARARVAFLQDTAREADYTERRRCLHV